MTYEKYCADCRDRGFEPTMDEKQFNEMEGIESETPIAPLHITPKKSNPKSAGANHAVQNGEVVESKKPKAARKPLTREQKDRQNEKRKKERAEARQKTPPKRISLEGMTEKEKQLHRNAQARARNAKRKAEGWVYPPKSAKQKEAQREYLKKYHQDKKNDPEYKMRRNLANKKHYRQKKKRDAENS